MGRIFEGSWDCPYCGNKVAGGTYVCPSCGHTRGADTKFSPTSVGGTKKYVPQEKIEAGPDWLCNSCGSYNRSSVRSCTSCGAARDSTSKDYFEVQKKENKEARQETGHSSNSTGTYSSRDSQKGVNHGLLNLLEVLVDNIVTIVILLGFITIVAMLIYVLIPKTVTLQVTDLEWERHIAIDEWKLVNENGWSLPEGAKLVDKRREIHHFDTVLDHYKTVTEQKSETYISGYDTRTGYRDLGNGYFEEYEYEEPVYDTRYYTVTHEEPVYKEVPVYATRYYYQIYRWVYERTDRLTGHAGTRPSWPEPLLQENERESSRGESYTVIGVTKKGKEVTYNIDFDLWEEVNVGATMEVKTVVGSITEIIWVE